MEQRAAEKQDWEDLPVTPPSDPAERDRLALDAIEGIVNADMDWSDELEAIYGFVEWSGRKVS
jgi:hypothetical protein